MNGAIGRGVLQEDAAGVLVNVKAVLITHQHLQAKAFSPGLANLYGLRVALILPHKHHPEVTR